jgi:ATP-dependent Lon protease
MAPPTAGAILIVDDEPSLVLGLGRLLARDGYSVDTASNGREAFAQLQTHRYDVVVSDLQMPEVDGRAFYALVRQHYAYLRHRVIFITGHSGDTDTLAFLTQCGVLWLRKPFTGAQVRHAIRQVLAHRGIGADARAGPACPLRAKRAPLLAESGAAPVESPVSGHGATLACVE